MRFTEKDWIATGLVAALIIVYGVYLAVDGAWLAQNARDMAIVGLVAGVLSRPVGGRTEFSPRWPAIVAAFATLGLGVVMITRNEVVLAAFILANVALMNAALAVHAHAQVAPGGHRCAATGVLR
jgi:hypothetical protein